MAGGGCQGGISGLKVCDFEVSAEAEGPVFRERSRYDKDAEVSACKIRMPDTCVFVLTSHSPLCLGWNPENELPRSENSR